MTALTFVLLIECSSHTNADENKALNSEIEVIPLEDSLIPNNVKMVTTFLEKNGIQILNIASSKWNLFGNQGIWLKTDKGIVDIIPFPAGIDPVRIQITPLNSEQEYTYKLKYNDTLLQKIQGKETFFVIGKSQIYKSTDKRLITEIEKVEFK